MSHWTRTARLFATLCCALGLAAPVTHAESLVQVTLSGMIEEDGGARVEFACEAAGREMSFRGLLARDTRPGDLAALLQGRLKRAGITVIPGPDSAPRGPYSLFVEDCEMIRLRLGGGLEGRLTAVEQAPTALKLLIPTQKQGDTAGDLQVSVSTENPGDGRYRVTQLELALPPARPSSSWAAERLASLCGSHGLKASRPTLDSWATSGTTSGELATGMSVELYSYTDWGVELRFKSPVASR